MYIFLSTVAIDMRGYSESDAPKGIKQYTVDKLTADVKEVITQLGKYMKHESSYIIRNW